MHPGKFHSIFSELLEVTLFSCFHGLCFPLSFIFICIKSIDAILFKHGLPTHTLAGIVQKTSYQHHDYVTVTKLESIVAMLHYLRLHFFSGSILA